MQLIAEQLRNKQIGVPESCRRAADIVRSAGEGSLEFILRYTEKNYAGIDRYKERIQELEDDARSDMREINDLNMKIATLQEELDKK